MRAGWEQMAVPLLVLRGDAAAKAMLHRFLTQRHAAEEDSESLLRDLTPCLEAALLLGDGDLLALLERKMAPFSSCAPRQWRARHLHATL